MEISRLVQQAQHGDQEAFTEICRRFEGLVKKQAFQGYLQAISEEALAQGRLAVVEAVQQYRVAGKVPFAGFAESKVKYALWNLFKKERRRWQHEIAPEGGDEEYGGKLLQIPSAVNVEQEVELQYMGEVLRQAIAQLPQRQQQAVVRLVIKGETLAVIARDMGVSLQAVHHLKQRGLTRLKKLCAGMYESERG